MPSEPCNNDFEEKDSTGKDIHSMKCNQAQAMTEADLKTQHPIGLAQFKSYEDAQLNCCLLICGGRFWKYGNILQIH